MTTHTPFTIYSAADLKRRASHLADRIERGHVVLDVEFANLLWKASLVFLSDNTAPIAETYDKVTTALVVCLHLAHTMVKAKTIRRADRRVYMQYLISLVEHLEAIHDPLAPQYRAKFIAGSHRLFAALVKWFGLDVRSARSLADAIFAAHEVSEDAG